MRRNYIIPTTESMAFHAGSICDGSAGAGTTQVTGNALEGGGQVPGGTNIDPM